MKLDEILLEAYPYPEKIETIKNLMAENTNLLNEGYKRILEQAWEKKHRDVVDFGIWSFMACDKALENSEKNDTYFKQELIKEIRLSVNH